MARCPEILLIDDDSAVHGLVKARLEGIDGFSVTVADNGKQGLELASTQQPDLILLDWMMPGIDGMVVLKALKNNERTAEIPVIMLTGKGKLGDVETALSEGAVNWVTKPIDLADLSRRATVALGSR